MNNSALLTDKIKIEAEKLGFFKIGFTRPESLDGGKFLKDWINDGFGAEMKWIEKSFDKRINPKMLYPEVKTIISTAISYFFEIGQRYAPETGKISRHALGDDYHIVVKEKLKKLFNYIKKEEKSADGKIFVDSSPVTEKIWAVKGGIGWMGKNSLLITREAGSWIFLGEIFLNIELNIDKPNLQDFCGKCKKCIDVCPTGAIVKPRIVNAEKCISYLTIEHKGEIPESLKPKIGSWIYGCDICQEVCPWNKFSTATTEKRFFPKQMNLNINLNEFYNISEKEFNQRFQFSPIRRLKLTGFKRNVRIALGNLKK